MAPRKRGFPVSLYRGTDARAVKKKVINFDGGDDPSKNHLRLRIISNGDGVHDLVDVYNRCLCVGGLAISADVLGAPSKRRAFDAWIVGGAGPDSDT
jgi:hypothetical protein